MPAASNDNQTLATMFAAKVQELLEVTPDEIELTLHDGDVEVPGFLAVSTRTPELTVRGWVRSDGTVVIPQRTPLVPLLEALRFADEPPPVDDDRLAEILAWGYGDRYTLLRSVAKGELGIKAGLACPPIRERRERDDAIVLRYVMRVEDPDDPAIMALAIARTPDGAYRFDGWQLAPRAEDDERDEDDDA